MPSPLEDIENRKAQQDIGTLGYRIYDGARKDGASRLDALLVAVAWFRAMINASNDAPPEDEGAA
jgi:hypothetical protein